MLCVGDKLVRMRIRFGCFALDDERLQLTREGRPVELRPKVFDLLAMLVRERHRVVRREELFERLWSTTAVGPGSLSGLVNELRSALGENGRAPSSIRTVHARGYQFSAPVEVEMADTASGRTRAAIARSDELLDASCVQIGDVLRRVQTEIQRSGARALVVSIPGRRERSAWLASAAAESLAAGFRPRWASIPQGPIELLEHTVGAQRGEPTGEGVDGLAAKSGARPARDPIALCLEIEDPGDWGRAGGLRRLLDLLGQAPVLVIAAVPARAESSAVRELAVPDTRVEWLEPQTDGRVPGGRMASVGARATAVDDLASVLESLARTDRPAFEAALRSMGFEGSPASPIRTPRRVEPSPAWAPARRDLEVG